MNAYKTQIRLVLIHEYINLTAPSLVRKMKSGGFSVAKNDEVNAAEDETVSDYTPARKKSPIHN